MNIEITWGISYSQGTVKCELEDVGCETEEEWNDLPEEDKKRLLQIVLDEHHERPSMILESYDIK